MIQMSKLFKIWATMFVKIFQEIIKLFSKIVLIIVVSFQEKKSLYNLLIFLVKMKKLKVMKIIYFQETKVW